MGCDGHLDVGAIDQYRTHQGWVVNHVRRVVVVTPRDFGHFTERFRDGAIITSSIQVEAGSRISYKGGYVTSAASCYDDGRLEVTGGTIEGRLTGYEFSAITMDGGQAGGVYLADFAECDIGGGALTDDLRAREFSTIRIHGHSFDLPLGEIAALSGSVNGVLMSGDHSRSRQRC
jgi:hypothetical protein